MTARKTSKAKGAKKTGRKASKAATARQTVRRAPARSAARKQPDRKAATPTASLAERLVELVEHAASGALRQAVDAGGRELASWLPQAERMRNEAGAYLREMRELTGLTVDELAEAVELRDRSLLEAVEAGTATLSFELLLRIAAIVARHDPVPFISRMVRAQNPVLWQLLEDWGLGRLPLQLEREQAFVNVLRSQDRARRLSDPDFDRVLDFTRAAFEMALGFASEDEEPGE